MKRKKKARKKAVKASRKKGKGIAHRGKRKAKILKRRAKRPLSRERVADLLKHSFIMAEQTEDDDDDENGPGWHGPGVRYKG